MTLTKTHGTALEVVGAISVFVGGLLGLHHLEIALPVLLGAGAIYAGRFIVAGKSV